MGNVMPRLRPNPIAGLRTEAMMRNPVAWRNAHASFGRMWLVGGAVVISTALLAPRYWMIAFIAVVIVSLWKLSQMVPRSGTLHACENSMELGGGGSSRAPPAFGFRADASGWRSYIGMRLTESARKK